MHICLGKEFRWQIDWSSVQMSRGLVFDTPCQPRESLVFLAAWSDDGARSDLWLKFSNSWVIPLYHFPGLGLGLGIWWFQQLAVLATYYLITTEPTQCSWLRKTSNERGSLTNPTGWLVKSCKGEVELLLGEKWCCCILVWQVDETVLDRVTVIV